MHSLPLSICVHGCVAVLLGWWAPGRQVEKPRQLQLLAWDAPKGVKLDSLMRVNGNGHGMDMAIFEPETIRQQLFEGIRSLWRHPRREPIV